MLLADGTIVTGANVENASYGLSLCAETVAIATVAGLSMAGIPPMNGFLSKEMMLDAAAGTALFGLPWLLPLLIAGIAGSIVFALTAALHGEITVAEGRVQQSSFPDQPLLPLARTPRIDVHLVPSAHPPGGVGEPGVPPLAPALANALFGLTGERLRSLPLRPKVVAEATAVS